MQKVIDIHCHMFNLKYLPVAGILRRYSNNIIPNLIARGTEWLLLKNTMESYPVKEIVIEQYAKPEYNIPMYQYLGEKTFAFSIKDIFEFNKKDMVTAMEQMALVGDVVEGGLSAALDEFEKTEANATELIKKEFASEDEKIRYRAGLLQRMLRWIVEKVGSMVNYIKWFLFMTHSEEAIYTYISTRDEPEVELFLHLLMDVDHFFNDNITSLKYKSDFDFETKQLDNMRQLQQAYPALKGFIAFNPARPNCMEIIKTAIRDKGYSGIKFYPPMGYKADGDRTYGKPIEELLSYCETNKIPLFAHCNNNGFEAWPRKNSGYDASPVYWEAALQKHPTLILNLGHAGGSEGWFSTNQSTDKLRADDILAGDIIDDSASQRKNWNNSYAAMVFKLCVKYENVYCDASYLDDMVNTDGSLEPQAKANFKDRLLNLFESEKKFAKKIMYGSDWHMIVKEARNAVFLSTYKKFFSEPELLPYSEDFFYNNAASYLKL